MDLVEVLSFLFMLSTMELGRVSHTILVISTVNVSGYHIILTPRNILRTH